VNQTVLDPQGPAAHALYAVMWMLFSVCGAVYVLVLIALGWALARRPRDIDDGPVVEARITRVVAGLTAITALILTSFVTVSAIADHRQSRPPTPASITVDVIGHQWWWDFQYRDSDPSKYA